MFYFRIKFHLQACFNVTYNDGRPLDAPPRSQINFLHLHSVQVIQRIRIKCHESYLTDRLDFTKFNEKHTLDYAQSYNNCQTSPSVRSDESQNQSN